MCQRFNGLSQGIAISIKLMKIVPARPQTLSTQNALTRFLTCVTCFWPVSDLFLTRFWPVSDLFLGRKLVELSRITHHRSLTSHNITARRSSRAGSRRTIDITNLECWGAQSAAPATKRIGAHHASKALAQEARGIIAPTHHTALTSHVTSPHIHSPKKFVGPKVGELSRIKHHTSLTSHHITQHHSANKFPRWKGGVRELPRETRFRPFREHPRTPKSTRITTKNGHRRSWRAGKYENYPEQAAGPPEVRDFKKMNYQRSWRAGNPENYHTKPHRHDRSHPECTRITAKNEHASAKPCK